jgi:NADP-reducing hydrogenase subunit HndB
MSNLSKEILENINQQSSPVTSDYIKVGMSTCGLAAGAQETYQTLVEETRKRNLTIRIQKCGCVGKCYAEPLVEVRVEGLPVVIYGKVSKEVAVEIVEKHLIEKSLINDHIFDFQYRLA